MSRVMTAALPIPRSPADITPAWLASVLGADVIVVDVTAIGTGQTGATYRPRPTHQGRTQLRRRALSRSSSPAGRRGPRTGGPRIPVRSGVLLGDHRQRLDPGPGQLPLRDLLRRSRFRAAAGRHGPRGAGRPDRRLQPGRGGTRRSRRSPGCTARAGATRKWFDLPAFAMPKPGDDDAAKGLGDVAVMARRITLDDSVHG